MTTYELLTECGEHKDSESQLHIHYCDMFNDGVR